VALTVELDKIITNTDREAQQQEKVQKKLVDDVVACELQVKRIVLCIILFLKLVRACMLNFSRAQHTIVKTPRFLFCVGLDQSL